MPGKIFAARELDGGCARVAAPIVKWEVAEQHALAQGFHRISLRLIIRQPNYNVVRDLNYLHTARSLDVCAPNELLI